MGSPRSANGNPIWRKRRRDAQKAAPQRSLLTFLIPLRAGSVAIGFVHCLRAGLVFLMHGLGRAIAGAIRLLGYGLVLRTGKSLVLFHSDRGAGMVMLDHNRGIVPLLDDRLCVGG